MQYKYRLYKPRYKRTVRRKSKNEVEAACENISRNALDPHQIKDTLAAIGEVNAAFSGNLADQGLNSTNIFFREIRIRRPSKSSKK